MKYLRLALVIATVSTSARVVAQQPDRREPRSQTVQILLTVGKELKPGAFVDIVVPTSPRKHEFVTGAFWFPDIDRPDAHSRSNLVHLQHVTVNVGQDQVVHLGVLTAAGAPISTKVRIVVEVRSLVDLR